MDKIIYTYEKVKELFEDRGYTLLSKEYKNKSTKLEYICPKHREHGSRFITLSDFLKGKGCYFCGRERTNEACKNRQISIEKCKQLCEKQDFTFVKKEVVDGTMNIFFIYNKHKDKGVQRKTVANMKHKCIYCTNTYTFTQDVYEQKLKDARPHIKLIGEYKGYAVRTKFYCETHNITFNKTPRNLLHTDCGCKYCGLDKIKFSKTKTIEEAQKQIEYTNPHIKLVKYNGADKECMCLCTIHKELFTKNYSNLKRGASGCKYCYAERIRDLQGTPHEVFIKNLKKKYPELSTKDNYINNHTPMTFYCSLHNCTFESTPRQILRRASCCNKSHVNYKENQVGQLLEQWGYDVIYQKTFSDCKDKNVLPFDFYLPQFRTVIEYQGEQHYKPIAFGGTKHAKEKLLYTQKHDNIKREYCKQHNITLIEIPYWEFDNLQSFLFDALVKNNAIIQTK